MTSGPSDPTPIRLGRHNPHVAELRRLVRGDVPDRTVVDGPQLVLEAAGRGVPIIELVVTESWLPAVAGEPALEPLLAAGSVSVVDDATHDRLAPTRSSQGVLAVVPTPEKTVPTSGFAVYLADVQDPGNVGAVIRCAAAFGASGVACSPDCANPFSPRAIRASAGHALALPVERGADLARLADARRSAGGSVAAAVGVEGLPVSGWRPRLPLLLVLGNEGHGLAPDVLAHATETVTVPLAGGVESLNVAVAAGVILAALAGVAPSPILERRT